MVHSSPSPTSTSDASALISGLLSRFVRPFHPDQPGCEEGGARKGRVLSGLSTQCDRNTGTAGPRSNVSFSV